MIRQDDTRVIEGLDRVHEDLGRDSYLNRRTRAVGTRQHRSLARISSLSSMNNQRDAKGKCDVGFGSLGFGL